MHVHTSYIHPSLLASPCQKGGPGPPELKRGAEEQQRVGMSYGPEEARTRTKIPPQKEKEKKKKTKLLQNDDATRRDLGMEAKRKWRNSGPDTRANGALRLSLLHVSVLKEEALLRRHTSRTGLFFLSAPLSASLLA